MSAPLIELPDERVDALLQERGTLLRLCRASAFLGELLVCQREPLGHQT